MVNIQQDGSSERQTTAVVDLFCGAGGLAYGLHTSGLRVVAGVDLDPACRYPLESNTNARFVQRDVASVTADDVASWFGDAEVRVLAGCAPCQPFSSYSRGRGMRDGRWALLREFMRLAVATRPEYVTMENVPGLASQSVWNEFVSALRNAGYTVWSSVVACVEFGVPQTRRRLVLIASLAGRVDLMAEADVKCPTVRDAIGNLPPIDAGGGTKLDPLHVSASLTSVNLEGMRASRPGGTWRDWPADLRAACHRKGSGKTYPSVYGRMEWDKPAPTMTTQCYGFGNGRFGHPEQDRAISLREAAIIQSFPETYGFVPTGSKVSFERLGTLIGNAVPPRLGAAIGRSILHQIAGAGSTASQAQGELNLIC